MTIHPAISVILFIAAIALSAPSYAQEGCYVYLDRNCPPVVMNESLPITDTDTFAIDPIEKARRDAVLQTLYEFHADFSGPPGELRKYYDDTVLENKRSKSIEEVMKSRYAIARQYPDRKLTLDRDTIRIEPLDDAGTSYRLIYENVAVVGDGAATETTRWRVVSSMRRRDDGANYRFYEVNAQRAK